MPTSPSALLRTSPPSVSLPPRPIGGASAPVTAPASPPSLATSHGSARAFVNLSELCSRSPSVEMLRSALRAHRVTRLDSALSALAAEVRVACAAAFTLAHCTPASVADLAEADRTARTADALVRDVRTLASVCAPAVAALARRFPGRAERVISSLEAVVGGGAPPAPEPPRPRMPCAPAGGPDVKFEHGVHMCLASVACGWDSALARAVWSSLGPGQYCPRGRVFLPNPAATRCVPGLPAGTSLALVSRPVEGGDVTVTFCDGAVVSVSCPQRLQAPARGPRSSARAGLSTLPSFIALPRDSEGRPIIPRTMVTTLVEHQDAWHTELGSIDAATIAIVRGLLVMPKVAVPSQQRVFRNHPSWENDPAAREALGPIIAKWLAQGILEYVEWDDRQSVLLQPCGAVPKGTAPFYRLITDARYGNRMYSDWGSRTPRRPTSLMC